MDAGKRNRIGCGGNFAATTLMGNKVHVLKTGFDCSEMLDVQLEVGLGNAQVVDCNICDYYCECYCCYSRYCYCYYYYYHCCNYD